MSIVLLNPTPRQNFGKITPAKYPSSLFCNANCSSRRTRGIFLVPKQVASSELTSQSINQHGGRSNLLQYEVLTKAFTMRDKLV